jgi:hypothetical protein
VSYLKPLLGLIILVLPFVLFWFLAGKKRLPKAEDNNNSHYENMTKHSGGGE